MSRRIWAEAEGVGAVGGPAPHHMWSCNRGNSAGIRRMLLPISKVSRAFEA